MKHYGLIGFPLGHSFSKKYFEQKFAVEKRTDCKFINYEIENIEKIKDVISDSSLLGFCITIPHKKNIIPYLHTATSEVKTMQACNCVQIREGILSGHNTDIIGFRNSFVPYLRKHHRQALILGTGGAAAAVAYVLKQLHIPYTFVSRTKKENQYTYEELNQSIIAENQIIINTSPVGSFPEMDAAPDIPYHFLTSQHYLYDLIYNPAKTKFLQAGQHQGAVIQNGYAMLTIQAEENWKIWNIT